MTPPPPLDLERLQAIRKRAQDGEYHNREHWGAFDADADVLWLVEQLADLHASHQAPGLSLSMQDDPFAISMMLDDSRRKRELMEDRWLRVIQAARRCFGDDAVRVSGDQFPEWLEAQIQDVRKAGGL